MSATDARLHRQLQHERFSALGKRQNEDIVETDSHETLRGGHWMKLTPTHGHVAEIGEYAHNRECSSKNRST